MSENRVRVIMSRRLRDERGAPVKGLCVVSEPFIDFPRDLLKAGIEGSAEIALKILEDGSVADTQVAAATHEQFGAAAKERIASWKLRPLAESEISAPAQIRCNLTFKTN